LRYCPRYFSVISALNGVSSRVRLMLLRTGAIKMTHPGPASTMPAGSRPPNWHNQGAGTTDSASNPISRSPFSHPSDLSARPRCHAAEIPIAGSPRQIVGVISSLAIKPVLAGDETLVVPVPVRLSLPRGLVRELQASGFLPCGRTASSPDRRALISKDFRFHDPAGCGGRGGLKPTPIEARVRFPFPCRLGKCGVPFITKPAKSRPTTYEAGLRP
jgi:hypothetical protein